jgi:hypothetical protein
MQCSTVPYLALTTEAVAKREMAKDTDVKR